MSDSLTDIDNLAEATTVTTHLAGPLMGLQSKTPPWVRFLVTKMISWYNKQICLCRNCFYNVVSGKKQVQLVELMARVALEDYFAASWGDLLDRCQNESFRHQKCKCKAQVLKH